MFKAKNLTGKRFGRLVAIKDVGKHKYGCRLWLCKCDCGNEKITLSRHLLENITNSCGCIRIERCKKMAHEQKINLLGQRFTRLVVIKDIGESKSGHGLWLCKCDCGNEKIIISTDLRSHKSKSCGCLKKDVNRQCRQKYNILPRSRMSKQMFYKLNNKELIMR